MHFNEWVGPIIILKSNTKGQEHFHDFIILIISSHQYSGCHNYLFHNKSSKLWFIIMVTTHLWLKKEELCCISKQNHQCERHAVSMSSFCARLHCRINQAQLSQQQICRLASPVPTNHMHWQECRDYRTTSYIIYSYICT